MKKLLTIGSAALLVAALALPAAAAQFAHIPAGPIKMDRTEKPVYFDHNIHTTADCTACHTKMPAHFPPLTVDYDKQCAVSHLCKTSPAGGRNSPDCCNSTSSVL